MCTNDGSAFGGQCEGLATGLWFSETHSHERVICSEPRHRLSNELRECMKTLSAQIRLETSEWMLQAMDRSSAGSQEGTSQPKTELMRNGPR